MKTWLITGASRGLGSAIAQAALASGDRVVATGREPGQVEAALGKEHDRLLIERLDVTDSASVAVGGNHRKPAPGSLRRYPRHPGFPRRGRIRAG